jgi:hypothetical protein
MWTSVLGGSSGEKTSGWLLLFLNAATDQLDLRTCVKPRSTAGPFQFTHATGNFSSTRPDGMFVSFEAQTKN